MKPPKRGEVSDEVWCAWRDSLQLSPRDEQRERWLASIVGPPTGARINLSNNDSGKRVSMLGPDEPTTQIACGRCGRPTRLATYLYDFLAAHGAKAPQCENCGPKEQR